MAEAVVSLALDTLRNLLLEEARFLSGVSVQVRGLEAHLKEIKCLLEDTDNRHQESKTVQNWIVEIRDLAYRTEDLIETYAVQVSSKQGRGLRKFLRRWSCALNEGITLHQIGSEIQNIIAEVTRLTRNLQDYGMRSLIQGESSATVGQNQEWKRQTFPLETEDYFIGMEEDFGKLHSLVIDKQHKIISVWGMGGSGKTTIARKIFNDVDIKQSFQSSAWVCISQKCQIRHVLEDILKQLVGWVTEKKREDVKNLSDVELIHQLYQVQREKRCLVVVDDLWEIEHWDALKHALTVLGVDNKVLLTTRNKNIASVGFAHKIQLLQEGDALDLLKKRALHGNTVDPDFGLKEKLIEKVGKEMIRTCGLLPLAISVLGGFLSKKPLEEWESINNNISAYLDKTESHDTDNKIHGVLDLSYDNLPFYLKPCFLYMACFKEDQILEPDVLFRSWVGEGLITSGNKGNERTLIDVAESYVHELASRSLVQVRLVEPLAVNSSRKYVCQLHDIIRELCIKKGKEEEFGLEVLHRQGRNCSILDNLSKNVKIRRLVVHFEGGGDTHLQEDSISYFEQTNRIRSLQFSTEPGQTLIIPRNAPYFRMFKLIRVLVFDVCTFESRKFPDEICKLIHLKLLRLQGCELDELPSSIKKLVNLVTLDLYGSHDVEISDSLNKLHQLKHLILPTYSYEKAGNYSLSLEGMNELETLHDFNSSVQDSKSLYGMKNIRDFHGIISDNGSLSTIMDCINTKWDKLQFCSLEIEGGCDFTSTQEGVALLKKVWTCPKLHTLFTDVPLQKVQLEFENQVIFSYLVFIVLKKSKLEDDPMEILERFPVLEQLSLGEESYLGDTMICNSGGFPRLKELMLQELTNLREWRVEQGAMPILSRLMIVTCPQLQMIPDGLRFITTLENLVITSIPELEKRVSKLLDDGREGEDFDKVRHVKRIVHRYINRSIEKEPQT